MNTPIHFYQVFDGIESNTSIVGKYCGSQKPPLIVSTINQLHLKFVADDSIESRGFKANYTFFSTSENLIYIVSLN